MRAPTVWLHAWERFFVGAGGFHPCRFPRGFSAVEGVIFSRSQKAGFLVINAHTQTCRLSESGEREMERYLRGRLDLRNSAERAWRYGLTEVSLELILKRQGGVCAICRNPGDLQIDHDHKDGTVRGALCRLCNLGLGHFRDNPTALTNAASYLLADCDYGALGDRDEETSVLEEAIAMCRKHGRDAEAKSIMKDLAALKRVRDRLATG